MFVVRVVAAVVATLCATACMREESNIVRGHGLNVESLSATQQARVYDAALRSAFDVDDPSLSLLLDARELPRTVGLEPGGQLPKGVTTELRRLGTVKGTCKPALHGTVGTAHCSAELPGYVVRFTPVFRLPGDSAEVYVYAQKYDTPASGISQVLRFERAYELVRQGSGWRAVREGRIPPEVRGAAR